ncbi:MAG: O-methyltransferase [Acidobacteria bacterium]|nr:MAG: O-methyltransferase [Acidobacteriota bacterium]
MNGITLQSVEQYMYRLLPPRDAVLADMERVAEKNDVPIVGPAVGRLLYQLARFVNAGRVFEMGSAIGYSTIWWARGLRRGGKVYYTDGSSANAAQAEGYLQKAGVRDRVEILVGNALDLIDQVEGEFDIVFNDVDKHDYPEVFRKAAGRIRVGGLLVADNVLWSGRVADAPVRDRDTTAIRSFNKMLFSDERFYSTIIPLRDGVAIGLRVQ